ncbi:uroporphyrinogen-III synthase [Cephus cinctus]|uniref:Uroporphyrinogen-III synthase n=1 Tax=Cephus cinctus TaxID=211228 RepID=A0AAJ7BRG4_CEPCN|nr:uroporphyrinogen-III synthase [Cephus cinctus]XP_024939492.1 uroporphyrinogen-III synthase [Cephus cinctus]XP_024939493.1 uroporphyrinogen-III synthase [Cephus cinctus]
MALGRKKVILCKGQNDKDQTQKTYTEVLESAGYTCEHLPALRFEFMNLQELLTCLLTSQSYSGIIFTSTRAVEAVNLAIKESKNVNIINLWKSLPAYCVGPATRTAANNSLGLENCPGAESGNAEQLGKQILNDQCQESAPLLYPCSEIARDTLSKILTTGGVKMKKLVVYRTLPSKTLEEDILKTINPLPHAFVFFSPSIVKYTLSLLKNHGILEKTKAVAIGSVTGHVLKEANVKVYAIAGKPDPISLVQAIKAADNNESNRTNME